MGYNEKLFWQKKIFAWPPRLHPDKTDEKNVQMGDALELNTGRAQDCKKVLSSLSLLSSVKKHASGI